MGLLDLEVRDTFDILYECVFQVTSISHWWHILLLYA